MCVQSCLVPTAEKKARRDLLGIRAQHDPQNVIVVCLELMDGLYLVRVWAVGKLPHVAIALVVDCNQHGAVRGDCNRPHGHAFFRHLCHATESVV